MSSEKLITFVLGFARALRFNGVKVSPMDSVDAIRSLMLLENLNRRKIYSILKAVFVKRFEDYLIFDMLFQMLYNKMMEQKQEEGETDEDILNALKTLDKEIIAQIVESNDSNINLSYKVMYSPYESKSKRELRNREYKDVIYARRSLKALTKLLATYRGLRYENTRKGYIDMRRTYRKNLTYGGDILSLMKRNRKMNRAKLVLVCDISGSMDDHSEKLFALMYCVANKFHKCSTFCFSTRLIDVGGYIRGFTFEKAKDNLSHKVDIWKSGTRIGYALSSLINNYPGILDQRTILIIVSDGLDLGDAEILRNSMKEIRRRVKHIVWFNPLADERDYRPYAIGMRTAMEFIDVFVPFSYIWNENRLRKEIIKQINNPSNKGYLFQMVRGSS